MPYILNQIQGTVCTTIWVGVFFCSVACAQPNAGHQSLTLRTFVYECESGASFIVNYKNDKAWIFLSTQTVALDHVPSDSGAKYSNGVMSFWAKGTEAMLETPEVHYHGCRNNRAKAIWEDAKLRGVDFRALGNEPGWYLEISEKTRLLFVSNYGQSRQNLTLSPPVTDQAARVTTYTAKNDQQTLTVIIEGRVCHDTMSGEQYESTVTVKFAEREYYGCGRALH